MVDAENHDPNDAACRSSVNAPSGRVVVAMSGGVDSSVVAGLMKRQGRDVIGITLQLYDHGEATGRAGSCCAGQDIHDARRVAEHLGIPHYVLDYERRFESAVMASFADSYLAGETPIPCVTCNQQIKFRDLLETAAELGAKTLATGHYIERRVGPDGPALYRAVDADRDQSYFLFATTPAQLARLEFPLGGMAKREVRRLAAELGLPVADKADSQDICFVPSGRYTDVIERLKPGAIAPGDIVDLEGRVLGRHNGIVNYTIGQRRGLGITGPAPLFVVKLDAERGQVVVGPREALASRRLVLRNINWLGSEPLEGIGRAGLTVSARVRSTQAPQPARLWVDTSGTAMVDLMDGGEVGVAPGQACVLYEDDGPRARMLGGGFIARALPAAAADTAGRRADPIPAPPP